MFYKLTTHTYDSAIHTDEYDGAAYLYCIYGIWYIMEKFHKSNLKLLHLSAEEVAGCVSAEEMVLGSATLVGGRVSWQPWAGS